MYPGPAPLVVWLGIPGIAAALALLFAFANRAAARRLGFASAAVRRRTLVAAALIAGWCALWGALAASACSRGSTRGRRRWPCSWRR